FTLSLRSPTSPSCARPSSTRPLPALPFGVAADYTLVKPMQTGRRFNSQVWLAALSAAGDPTTSPTRIVFKIIIPSHGDFPGPDMSDKGILQEEGREFKFPYDVVMGEVASYGSLADFQGSTLPYCYGVHEVIMPWNEPAWLLVFEWIPGPNLQVLFERLVYGKETKYNDIELYKRLFHSALDTLQTAHKRDVFHNDVRRVNVLIDEVNDQAVWIDWTSDHGVLPDLRAMWRKIEINQFVDIFLARGTPHVLKIRRLANELGLVFSG
ncbi:hypothetical protein C8T65DRAFT_577774, partial [Cerioporus squamosus]